MLRKQQQQRVLSYRRRETPILSLGFISLEGLFTVSLKMNRGVRDHAVTTSGKGGPLASSVRCMDTFVVVLCLRTWVRVRWSSPTLKVRECEEGVGVPRTAPEE